MSAKKYVTARDLMSLLAKRHADDLFVPECKDGPTQTGEHLRLDGWAMKRSWAHPCFDGYEVKVSRSDFRRDAKFTAYLPLCNRLWVVCPSGLIEAQELPVEVGLLWAPKTGGDRLVTKRKATYRNIETPESLLLYVLMCRAEVPEVRRSSETRSDRARYWKDFVEGRTELRSIGNRAARKLRVEIRSVLQERDLAVLAAEARRNDAERELSRMSHLRQIAEEFGLLDRKNSIWGMRDAIAAAVSGSDLESKIHEAKNKLDVVLRLLEQVRSAGRPVEECAEVAS